MIYLCITPERAPKTSMIMSALMAGSAGEGRLVDGEPPDDGNPFVVWGQEWLALRIIPRAVASGRPFWHIDNGFWQPGRGKPTGYYRFCYRGMTPAFLPKNDSLRPSAGAVMRPWRERGDHVVLAMPGVHYGLALGYDVQGWCDRIVYDLPRLTDRRILVRPRDARRPLQDDLKDAWALVTHSSNVGVDAVLAGIPVFVAPTSPAAPVGRTDLEIEAAISPGRARWARSLASQHFTPAEMRAGIAWHWMQRIAQHVDEARAAA